MTREGASFCRCLCRPPVGFLSLSLLIYLFLFLLFLCSFGVNLAEPLECPILNAPRSLFIFPGPSLCVCRIEFLVFLTGPAGVGPRGAR
jgi:hypothetical protein